MSVDVYKSQLGIEDLFYGTGTQSVKTSDVETERTVHELNPIDVRAYDSLSDAITDIGSDDARIIIPEDISLGANVTVPANVEIDPLGNAVITLGAYNLTMNGHFLGRVRDHIDDSGAGSVTWGKYPKLADFFTWVIKSPEVTTIPGPKLVHGIRFLRFDAFVIGGTSAALNIEIRDTPTDGTPTNIFSSELTAVAAGLSSTTFAVATADAGKWLFVDISAVTGVVTVLNINLMKTR